MPDTITYAPWRELIASLLRLESALVEVSKATQAIIEAATESQPITQPPGTPPPYPPEA